MVKIDSDVEMPRFIDVAKLRELTCLGNTAIYQLINDGQLRRVKLGKKTVFVEAEVRDWLNLKIKQSPLIGRKTV